MRNVIKTYNSFDDFYEFALRNKPARGAYSGTNGVRLSARRADRSAAA